MRPLAIVLSAVLAATAAAGDNQLTDTEKADGWILLFDGTSYDGWEGNKGEPVQGKPEDGLMLPYKSGSYVMTYTERPFDDFVLECDVKMAKEDANSGVFFWVSDRKDPVYSGFEIQVYKGGTGRNDFGSLYDLKEPDKNLVKSVGQWNHLKIVGKGSTVEVSVNGEKVLTDDLAKYTETGLRPDGSKHKFGKAMADLPTKGYIGFQDHGDKVWFKNVKVKPLD